MGRLETSEPSLIRAGTAGEHEEDDSEFRAVFLAYYPKIVNVLQRLTGNRSDAEDLAGEVFVRLSRRGAVWWRQEGAHHNVGGWLYRAATHAGIDFLRSRKRRSRREETAAREVSDRSDENRGGPLANVIREEAAERVRAVLTSMKPAWAQLLLMRAGEAGYAEIAESLGLSVGSVGTLLNRAEADFRKRYVRVTARKEMR